jgi:hypothetical protein
MIAILRTLRQLNFNKGIVFSDMPIIGILPFHYRYLFCALCALLAEGTLSRSPLTFGPVDKLPESASNAIIKYRVKYEPKN